MEAFGLAVLLVAYNNAMNRWPAFRGPAYVPANLALTAAVVGLALGGWDLAPGAIGLGPGQGAWLLTGAAAGGAAALPLLLALAHRRTRAAIADRRMAGVTNRQLWWRAVVRVPLGTALCEEILFRGVLYASLPSGWTAAVGSSIAFGLWHAAPTYNLLEENGRAGGGAAPAGKVVLGMLFTGTAGLFLVWLRTASGGIAAPFAFHATLNGLGTVAAVLAGRPAQRAAESSR